MIGLELNLSRYGDLNLPNKSVLKKLAHEWQSLSDEQKLKLRAQRSKRGVICKVCGKNGYYREICPNQCVSPPPTPDSSPDSTPPTSPIRQAKDNNVCMLWGRVNINNDCDDNDYDEYRYDESSTHASYNISSTSDSTLRTLAREESTRLHESDNKVHPDNFYTRADKGYARNLPELTLHQIMRRLMRILEQQLQKNITKLENNLDVTLLHPSADIDRNTFYPNELNTKKYSEYREYFYKKENNKPPHLSHEFLGSLRPVDDLHDLFRGGNIDRSHYFESNTETTGQSIHSTVGWKSTLARYDSLASSDPSIAKQQQQVKKLLENQGKWAKGQKRSMQHLNDRFEHMVAILRAEISKEHARESSVLQARNKRERRDIDLKLWKDRFDSIDRLITTLKAYKVTSGIEEADFLMYCLQEWENISISNINEEVGKNIEKNTKNYGKITKNNMKSNSMLSSSASPYYESTIILEKMFLENNKNKSKNSEKSQKLNEIEEDISMYDNNVSLDAMVEAARVESEVLINIERKEKARLDRVMEGRRKGRGHSYVIQHIKKPKEIDEENMAKAKKNFKSAGLGLHIRKGNETDLSHLSPALIPVPQAFEVGRTVSSQLSSYTAEGIMFDIRKNMILADSGYTPQAMLPLFVRNTLIESNGTTPGGDQTHDIMALDTRYSHYIGRPLNRFETPDQALTLRGFDNTQVISPYKRAGIENIKEISHIEKLSSDNISHNNTTTLRDSRNKSYKYENVNEFLPKLRVFKNSTVSSTVSSTVLTGETRRKAKRLEMLDSTGLSTSLVRLAFGKASTRAADQLRTVNDYFYEDEDEF